MTSKVLYELLIKSTEQINSSKIVNNGAESRGEKWSFTHSSFLSAREAGANSSVFVSEAS